ncbi:T6SS phospholipase effector Tle1-like catalytic domain-containing protein [Dyella caseinilytica]|uniref:DUF2235 domain-containing protein n=1 Tax=Dyella caseinilytica TaxID=1849581 RepID=A0ABX7GQS3_9GAMM|nr:DUF2235 domain-containing protein [Dyella caseinilytica]QRN52742.1 DUF2235 domain-containing protein [Dyella caseinilytica]GGA08362.1 hypothetical protein GCM10011408_32170 [Dyella caseinilytica]
MAYVEGKYANIIIQRDPRPRDTVLCDRHGWYYDLLESVPGRSDDFGQSGNVLNAFKIQCGCYVMAESDFTICGKNWKPDPPPSTIGGWNVAPAKPTRPKQEQAKEVEYVPPDVCVIIRIGLFFDGTGNNASNTAMAEMCRASTGDELGQSDADQAAIAAHCKPYMLESSSSYDNGISNVARLFKLYRDDSLQPYKIKSPYANIKRYYYVRIYVDGIGTTAGKPDSLLPGYSFGTGDTGMIARVQQALSQTVLTNLNIFAGSTPGVFIEALEFDVFGFSRGAAAARHCVNEINRKDSGPLNKVVLYTKAQFKDGFHLRDNVAVNFVGLFDTVVARGSLADGFNVRSGKTGPLHVGLPTRCARQVVQIHARDEHRANFMLTTVQPQHRDIALPGVHSDIGGGYNKTEEGPLMMIKPIHSVEALQHRDGDTYAPDPAQSTAWQKAKTQRQMWKEKLGDIDDSCLAVDGWRVLQQKHTDRTSVVNITQPVMYATVKLERPIDPSYQLIPLRLMHKVAKDAGVPFQPIPEEYAYALPDELEPIATKLLAGQPLDPEEEALLARKYLHQSAHWNFGATSKYLEQEIITPQLLYPNRPDPSGKRVVLDNV